jgi:hypothetical protein
MSLIQFTLIVPVALEEAVLDTLLEHPEWVSGFTSMEVSGHGQALAHATSSEAVRGRVRRLRVDTVMQHADALQLVALLKISFPHPEAAYWMMDVQEFGRFV